MGIKIQALNTYHFTHQYEGRTISVPCCATSFEQANRRMSAILNVATMHYQGWSPGVKPRIHIEDILPHSQDVVCKEYPYESVLVE